MQEVFFGNLYVLCFTWMKNDNVYTFCRTGICEIQDVYIKIFMWCVVLYEWEMTSTGLGQDLVIYWRFILRMYMWCVVLYEWEMMTSTHGEGRDSVRYRRYLLRTYMWCVVLYEWETITFYIGVWWFCEIQMFILRIYEKSCFIWMKTNDV